MQVDLSINPSETSQHLAGFIKQTLIKTGFSKLVIGLSGGIDSAASLALAVRAIGAENIYAGIFPYGELNDEGTVDAKLIADSYKIPQENISLINIKPLVDPILQTQDLESYPTSLARAALARLRLGNIMARIRMILLYDMSKKNNALVLGTENKTENLLGYFTRFGDEASDLEPLRGLYKTQVLQLASFLKIPEKIIKKTPTAGMWLGQTDEKEFGFTYEEADKILCLWHDRKYTREAIVNSGLNPEIVEKVIKRAVDNSFKHKLPYSISV